MAPEPVDILVVGGGFAGLRAARAAAAAGARTVVLERRRTLGSPVRTSGGSWIHSMKALGIPPALYHPVRKARFHSAGRSAAVAYPGPVGCILHVERLAAFLGDEARAAGAELRLGEEAIGLARDGTRIQEVASARGRYRPGIVVDASGISGFLARGLGKGSCRRFGLGYEVDVEAPGADPEAVDLWLGPPLAPAGYAWAFPTGDGRVRVGVGVLKPDHPESPQAALERLLASGRPEVAPLAGRPRGPARHGAIPADPPALPLVGPGWLAAGDAAGQASPLLGEGIRFGLELGAEAGRAAAAALADQNPSPLEDYVRTWEARYGRKFRLEHALNRRMAGLDARGWDKAVALLGALGEAPLLELLQGQYTPGVIMGLAIRHPTLAARIAWAMVAG